MTTLDLQLSNIWDYLGEICTNTARNLPTFLFTASQKIINFSDYTDYTKTLSPQPHYQSVQQLYTASSYQNFQRNLNTLGFQNMPESLDDLYF